MDLLTFISLAIIVLYTVCVVSYTNRTYTKRFHK